MTPRTRIRLDARQSRRTESDKGPWTWPGLQGRAFTRIESIAIVFVDDQAEALTFDSDVLGFVQKHVISLGTDRWLTVVSPDDPDGPEPRLEPSRHPGGS